MTLIDTFTQYKKLFITGTDTEVGKTYCASLMVKHLLDNSVEVFPFKPIAAGTRHYPDVKPLVKEQINEDAFCLWQAVQKRYSLTQINPIVFEQPIAPHIAAGLCGQTLDFERLDKEFSKVSQLGEVQLIEGAGGWHLPLNNSQLLSDWVAQQQLPVIMVVGVKLGCLNHALLTAQAIQSSGCKLVGWVANFIEGETDIAKQNVEFIKQKLNVPLLYQVLKGQTSLVSS